MQAARDKAQAEYVTTGAKEAIQMPSEKKAIDQFLQVSMDESEQVSNATLMLATANDKLPRSQRSFESISTLILMLGL